MTVAYATSDQLADRISGGVAIDDADRILMRASELLDDKVTAAFAVSRLTGLPSDPTVAQAMADACCAQVEFWAEVGEEHDVTGLAGRQVTIGRLSMASLPPELAPRAARILRSAGLLGPGPGPYLPPEDQP